MKRGKNKFEVSNRILYTLISLGILSLFAVGVYAAQQSAAGGTHNFAEVGLPSCSDGQVLKWSGTWACGTDVDTNTWGPVAGGLYGRCFTSNSVSYSGARCLSNWASSPAYCTSGGGCACSGGYTAVLTGGIVFDSSARGHEWYYSCRKD